MSYNAERYILEQNIKPAKRKFYLLRLAARMSDETGVAYPSQKTLAQELSMSERTIREIQNDCIKDGEIEVESRRKANGRQTSNGYTIPGFMRWLELSSASATEIYEEEKAKAAIRAKAEDDASSGRRRTGGPAEDGGPADRRKTEDRPLNPLVLNPKIEISSYVEFAEGSANSDVCASVSTDSGDTQPAGKKSAPTPNAIATESQTPLENPFIGDSFSAEHATTHVPCEMKAESETTFPMKAKIDLDEALRAVTRGQSIKMTPTPTPTENQAPAGSETGLKPTVEPDQRQQTNDGVKTNTGVQQTPKGSLEGNQPLEICKKGENSEISPSKKRHKRTAAEIGYTPAFERFFAEFPTKRGMSKPAALKSWIAQGCEDIADDVILGAKEYAVDIASNRRTNRNWRDSYIKHAQGWLTDRRWEGYAEEVRKREAAIAEGKKRAEEHEAAAKLAREQREAEKSIVNDEEKKIQFAALLKRLRDEEIMPHAGVVVDGVVECVERSSEGLPTNHVWKRVLETTRCARLPKSWKEYMQLPQKIIDLINEKLNSLGLMMVASPIGATA